MRCAGAGSTSASAGAAAAALSHTERAARNDNQRFRFRANLEQDRESDATHFHVSRAVHLQADHNPIQYMTQNKPPPSRLNRCPGTTSYKLQGNQRNQRAHGGCILLYQLSAALPGRETYGGHPTTGWTSARGLGTAIRVQQRFGPDLRAMAKLTSWSCGSRYRWGRASGRAGGRAREAAALA